MNSAIIEGILFGTIPVLSLYIIPKWINRRKKSPTKWMPQPSSHSPSSPVKDDYAAMKEAAFRNFESLREMDLRYLNVQDTDIDKMLVSLSKDSLSAQEIHEILGNPQEYPVEKINQIAVATALKYWNREMEYLPGDIIMNNIILRYSAFGDIFPSEQKGFAWECFLAFDSGEFFHPGDGPEVDPTEKYTRTHIEEILRMTKLIA